VPHFVSLLSYYGLLRCHVPSSSSPEIQKQEQAIARGCGIDEVGPGFLTFFSLSHGEGRNTSAVAGTVLVSFGGKKLLWLESGLGSFQYNTNFFIEHLQFAKHLS
jgi:hypothetical protein